MTIAWTIIAFCSLLSGFLLGLMWAPRLLRKKYDQLFEAYKTQLQLEVEQTRAVQKKITEEYQQIIQEDLYNYMLTTAEPPPTRDDMN